MEAENLLFYFDGDDEGSCREGLVEFEVPMKYQVQLSERLQRNLRFWGVISI